MDEREIMAENTETQKKLDKALTTLDSIERLLQRHDKVLFGSLENEEYPGLIMDVDRLKIHKKNMEKTTLVMWTTAIGLVINTIWSFITNHKGS